MRAREAGESDDVILRPARVCEALLAAHEAADGRRKQRKRDQTPDALGLAVKRALLERAVAEDPTPERFEAWLMAYARKHESAPFPGAVSAMARAVRDEWRLAHAMRDFAVWLTHGAPSDDASPPPTARS
jgi:hypothetical protein